MSAHDIQKLNLIYSMRVREMPLSLIAAKLNVSRQRIHQILIAHPPPECLKCTTSGVQLHSGFCADCFPDIKLKNSKQGRENYLASVPRAPTKEEWTARGICYQCRKRPHAEGIQMCRPCADAFNKRCRKSSKLRTQERLKNGICIRCRKSPAVEGKSSCKPCAAQHSKRTNRDYKARVKQYSALGICFMCRKRPMDSGTKRCKRCRKQDAKKQRERYAEKKLIGWKVATRSALV